MVSGEDWDGSAYSKRGKVSKKKKTRKGSNLALDVNSAEGLRSGAFERLAGLARKKIDVGISFFKQMLAAMVDNELRRIDIRLKTKLLSDETKLHIWFVSDENVSITCQGGEKQGENSRFTDVAQSCQAFATNKHVHQVRTHVRSVQIKLEKAMVVAQRQG